MGIGRKGFWLLQGALLLFLAIAGTARAGDLTGREIMEKVDRLYRSKDEKAATRMEIFDRQGKSMERELDVFLKQGEGDDDMLLMRFTSPARVRGTGLLTVEHTGEDDDQWLYLPALRKTKRIASSDRTESFAGTDFTYEDLRTEDLARSRYELVKTEELEGVQCYVVEAFPSTKEKAEESGYSKRVLWVRAADFLVAKVAFHDKQNRHVKTLLVSDFRNLDGLWRAFRSEMRDLVKQTHTVWTSEERKLNVGLNDSLFTKRGLERGS